MELLEAVLARVVGILRVLLGVQVVEVAEELVEAVDGR
jgi:xanthosine utilization system XapX-like protein